LQAEADIWAIIERGSTNPPTVPGATKPPAEDEENRREWGRLRRNIRIADFFAAFVWIYSATKLFVADVDRMAIHRIFPQADWLVDFRLVFVAALALAVALFFWNKWTMAFVVYIVLFPLLVVVWKIPALIYRRHSWLLAMAVINSAVLFFRNLRFHLITKASGP
jgi:hypothetical protein